MSLLLIWPKSNDYPYQNLYPQAALRLVAPLLTCFLVHMQSSNGIKQLSTKIGNVHVKTKRDCQFPKIFQLTQKHWECRENSSISSGQSIKIINFLRSDFLWPLTIVSIWISIQTGFWPSYIGAPKYCTQSGMLLPTQCSYISCFYPNHALAGSLSLDLNLITFVFLSLP